jgi:membrane-bound lytic murein transglycosylase D
MIKKFKRIFILLGFFLPVFVSYSQTNDSITNINRAVNNQIEQNLDSLLNKWYVKNALKNNNNYSSSLIDTMQFKNIADSVFIARLNKIPSLIPLTYNIYVRKYIEFYLSHGKNATAVLLGLSTYYFPIFEEIIDKYDLPHELKYLPVIESAFNPRVKSYAGAVGLWQIIYPTGKFYNLEINSLIDERCDPIKSTYAAVQLLKDFYAVYKDWDLTLAAYNCGPGNVNRAIKRSNGKTSYYDIYNYLPYQTRNYLPCYVAAVYVMNYYKEHNISPIAVNLPLNTDTIMINKKLHLQQVSDVLKIPIDELRDMNPQYKKDIIPGLSGYYSLKLPIEYSTKFVELADSIYKYKDTLFFAQKKIITTAKTYETSYRSDYEREDGYVPPSKEGKELVVYTVKSGDTYGYIASWFGVRVSDLKYWNDAYTNYINVNQKLNVWVPSKKARLYKNIDFMSYDEKQAAFLGIQKGNISPAALDNSYIYYTIQSGDLLSTIAMKYPGITEADIRRVNSFTDNDVKKLQIGQMIKIKKKS